MHFKVSWVENKNPDWKIATLIAIDGTQTESVSINRTNKKGEVFPEFDAISPGKELDGELWTSDAGKKYLFAPRPQTASGGRGSQAIAKAQERKAEDIHIAQDNKAEGIKISSTIRMAVDLAIAQYDSKEGQPLENLITEWRSWLWKEWDKTDKDFDPF